MSDLSHPRTGASPLAPQTFVIAALVRYIRLRLATQRGAQRTMSLATLRATFDDEEQRHGSTLAGQPGRELAGAAHLDGYRRLRDEVLREIASGLTPSELGMLGG